MDKLIVNRCPECDDRGYLYKYEEGKNVKVKCTNRWHDSHLMEKQKKQLLGVEELEKLVEEYVPAVLYREIDFDKKELLRGIDVPKALIAGDEQFEDFVDGMSMIIRELRETGKISKGYYVWGPDGTGKKFFVYTLIKELLALGKQPTKFSHLSEYSDAIVTGDYRKVNEWLDGKDLVLVSIKGMIATQIIYGLDYLLERCELKGIPLIVVGQKSYYGGIVGSNKKAKTLGNKLMVGAEVPNNYYGKLQDLGIGKSLENKWYYYMLEKMEEEAQTGLEERRKKREDVGGPTRVSGATRGPKKK